MAAVRLGKNHLRWCDDCNLPVLESKTCPICGKDSREVEITPPGDVRPAFQHDIDLIRKLADEQYGEGSGIALLPEGHPVLLNKAPSLDRMDEIIIDGSTVATIRYDLGRGWRLINRMQSAMRIAPVMTKGYVICDDSAVPFVQDSKNLMAPGVIDAHKDIKIGDEVIVITKDRKAIATGAAKMEPQVMIDSERGLAVKTKWVKPEPFRNPDKKYTWDEVVEANREVIEKRRDEAVDFINKNIAKHDVPAIVSFSGGKDSLATLLLTLDAGHKLPVLFVNTGLEFDETVEHVRDVTSRHGLKLIEETAPTDAFFGNLVHFGPPAKDFRWCCKTNKLGPTVGAIMKNFPDGVLSFIGQRKYESEARHDKGRVWVNPWTPGQTGASPIQNWNALHVWFYIFLKKEPFNVWYTRGLDRIGCFLCPASDMSELEIVAGNSSRYGQWDQYLTDYMNSRGLPQEWKDYALWRWKNAPSSIREEVHKITGKDVSELTKQSVAPESGPLYMKVQEGFSPCVIGFSVEAAVSKHIDIERLEGFGHILGSKVKLDESGEWLSIDNITVYREGSIISKANVERDARSNIDKLFELIVRSEQCVGCSLCVARCEQGALYMKDGRVEIDPDECIRCKDCLGPCPAVNFRAAEQDL
ncbi:MAG: phosphoadenosine phosphosulfate reductase family protein [Candidatus Methanomethylophilaceae archaeon]|nr:phosphoadenosine phosphosulfate reductase family protein [Candidatus Methanomethylophilaceae archaeon]